MPKPRRTTKRRTSSAGFVPCGLRQLPRHQWGQAARDAIAENPRNRPPVELLRALMRAIGARGAVRAAPLLDLPETTEEDEVEAQYIAVATDKYWRGGVDLSVGFLESVQAALADKILSHLNAWAPRCGVRFSMAAGAASRAQVRITLRQSGYWSYLGTDVLQIPPGSPTMCLQNFSLNTPESEYKRVVRHECGHTLGCPHEHMRADIVNQLDPQKTIKYFQQTQGWTAQQTQQQVLTPVSESSIMGTESADETSIMCYQLPASITKDGQPIPGGTDINENDYKFMSGVYPPATTVPPPDGGTNWTCKVSTPCTITGSGAKPIIS